MSELISSPNAQAPLRRGGWSRGICHLYEAQPPDDLIHYLKQEIAAALPSVSVCRSGPKRETTIDDDGLARNHRRSHTQEYNYISYVLRHARALQKPALFCVFVGALFHITIKSLCILFLSRA
jgi:hypothetical protein